MFLSPWRRRSPSAVAGDLHLKVKVARAATNRFAELHAQVVAQVITWRRATASRAATAAAEEAFKEILDAAAAEATLEAALESTRESACATRSGATRSTTNAGLAELVIAGALPRVGEHLIGVVDLLEFGRSVGGL